MLRERSRLARGPTPCAALTRFEELGFPTTRLEAWRYTNVAPIQRGGFAPSACGDAVSHDPHEFDGHRLKGASMLHVVCVDGRFVAELSTPSPESPVRVHSLSQALRHCPELVEPHLGALATVGERPFVALNTTFFGDGAFVHVPAGAELDQPVHIHNITTRADAALAHNPRHLILLGDHARATILESYAHVGAASYFTNAVTEVALGNGAAVDHYKLQEESAEAFHIATLAARLGADAELRSHLFSFGASLARSDVVVDYTARGASCFLNGLFVVDGEQHVDCQTHVDHSQPYCSSEQNYRGILNGRSRGVFQGGVTVQQDAQKTTASQSNRNLVLSSTAKIDTKPQLVIHADDVKCAHGATIGQLDEDAIFFLRSRGIGELDAKSMLTRAFANEIASGVRVGPLRERIDLALAIKLSGVEFPMQEAR